MNTLLDTNILTRLAEPGHAHYRAALDSTDLLGKQGHGLFVVPQVLYECWVVMTRPTGVNGLGKSAAEAAAELATFKVWFGLLDDAPAIFPAWERLVTSAGVIGKSAHDARLVAAMTVHGITHLLTFNDRDFRRFPAITVLTPADVLAAPPPGT